MASETTEELSSTETVLIYSVILDDILWVTSDRSFKSDSFVVYYEDELAAMADKTPEQLRAIHRVKKVFAGSRVVK